MDVLNYASIKRIKNHYVLYISFTNSEGLDRVEEEVVYSMEDAISYLRKNFITNSAQLELNKSKENWGFL